MSRELALVIVLALLAWALFAVWRGWRARRSKYAHLPLLSDSAAVARSLFDVLYVARQRRVTRWSESRSRRSRLGAELN